MIPQHTLRDMSRLSPVDDDDEVSFHPSTAYDGTSQLIRVGRKYYQVELEDPGPAS